MAAVPTTDADTHGTSDSELIEAVRNGDTEAYGQLYERHVGAAYAMARQVTKSQAEADDVVSEAFAKVLDLLRDQRGPTSAFRAYVLTAIRHVSYDRIKKQQRLRPTEDLETIPNIDISQPFNDTAVAAEDRSMIAQAFASLPERWQTVLWHVEIEGESPAKVAPLLGLTANGVSALAYRAREGLKQAYLQVHLTRLDAEHERCRETVSRLGSWTRDGLSKREKAQVEKHLDDCDRCRALAAELAEVNSSLRVVVAPLVLGGSATGYLTAVSAGGAAVGGSTTGGIIAAIGPRRAAAGAGVAAAIGLMLALAFGSGNDEKPPVAASDQQDSNPNPQSPPQAPPAANPPPAAPAPAPAPGQQPAPAPAQQQPLLPIPLPLPLPALPAPLPPLAPQTDNIADTNATVGVGVLGTGIKANPNLGISQEGITANPDIGIEPTSSDQPLQIDQPDLNLGILGQWFGR